MAQQLSIKGVKFFQEHLDFIRMSSKETEKPYSAASLAVYILCHFECDPRGVIRAHEQKLQEWSIQTGIPYSTLHTGRKALFDRGLLVEGLNGNDPIYIINGYERLNTPEKHSDKPLSYFRIPTALIKSSVLKELVSRKNGHGIILLLELLNAFTRDIRKAKSVKECVIVRSINKIKDVLKKGGKKAVEWFTLVKDIFHVEFNVEERHPREDRDGICKVNNPIQIHVKKFILSLKEECVEEENDPHRTKGIINALRKELHEQFNRRTYPLHSDTARDIILCFKEETVERFKHFTEIPYETLSIWKVRDKFIQRDRLISHIFLETLEDIFEYYQSSKKADEGFSIRNLAGLFRNKVRVHTAKSLQQDLSASERIEMMVAGNKKWDGYQAFFQKINQIKYI